MTVALSQPILPQTLGLPPLHPRCGVWVFDSAETSPLGASPQRQTPTIVESDSALGRRMTLHVHPHSPHSRLQFARPILPFLASTATFNNAFLSQNPYLHALQTECV